MTVLLSQLVWQIQVQPMIQQDYLRLLVLCKTTPPEPCRKIKHVFKVAAPFVHTIPQQSQQVYRHNLLESREHQNIVRVANWHHFIQSWHESIRACSSQGLQYRGHVINRLSNNQGINRGIPCWGAGRTNTLPGCGSACTYPCTYVISAKASNSSTATSLGLMDSWCRAFWSSTLQPSTHSIVITRWVDNCMSKHVLSEAEHLYAT